MLYPHTNYCSRCIDRKIADADEILQVLSNPHNHAEKRRLIVELLQKRSIMKEQCEFNMPHEEHEEHEEYEEKDEK